MGRQGPSLQDQIDAMRAGINARLAELAPAGPPAEELNQAIRYSLLAKGRRVRSLITVMTAVHLGAGEEQAYDSACAIEMVHTASLIVDDLPAMDDAHYRRGQATSHRVYGEDLAILAAFALVNQSFDVVSRARGLDAELRLDLVRLLSRAIGMNGIIAGQQHDLRPNGTKQNTGGLRHIHSLKTGALFVAAAEAGARIAGLAQPELSAIRAFGENFGLAYQMRDDLLDVFGTLSSTGKDVHADSGKTTFVTLLGEESAWNLNKGLIEAAIGSLKPLGPRIAPLGHMARSLNAAAVEPFS